MNAGGVLIFFCWSHNKNKNRMPKSVISLKPTALEQAVNDNSVVLFHSPECTHCTNVMPAYQDFAAQFRRQFPDVNVTRVNVDKYGNDIYQQQVGKYVVPGGVLTEFRSYPTMMAFHRDGAYSVFDNKKTAENMTEFATQFYSDMRSSSGNSQYLSADEQSFDSKEEFFQGGGEQQMNLEASIDDVNNMQNGVALFYADWCGHCKRFKPIYEEFAQQATGDFQVAQIDFHKARASDASKCEKFASLVRGYPTVLFIKDGEINEYKGARSMEGLNAKASELF